uniref:hypothetical protein n=1 Tax=Bacillus sp. WP8 TaxID=756828 RepID=UPI001C92D4D2
MMVGVVRRKGNMVDECVDWGGLVWGSEWFFVDESGGVIEGGRRFWKRRRKSVVMVYLFDCVYVGKRVVCGDW